MTDEKKRISIDDLPESGTAALGQDDVQPADGDVKGGGRYSIRRAGIRRTSFRRQSPTTIRVGKRLLEVDNANTWRSK